MEDSDKFAAERERIEERHRIEVLKLLRSFEFERNDLETRLRAEFEQNDTSRDTDGFLQELEELDEKFGSGDDELRQWFENEKESFLKKIKELENEVVRSKKEDDYQEEVDTSLQDAPIDEEEDDLRSNPGALKSLPQLEEENNNLKVDLDDQRSKVAELQNHLRVFQQKLDDIANIVNDQATFAESREKILGIIDDSFVESTEVIPTPTEQIKTDQSLSDSPVSNSPQVPNDPQVPSSSRAHSGSHVSPETRSDSLVSFQIEELNVENEELKNNVRELEKKIRKTVEEYELQREVFKEKLDAILQRLESDSVQEENEGKRHIDKVTLDEIKEIKLEETPKELIEKYVTIVLGEKFASKSPDLFEINLQNEIYSLEHLLDIEIFDGRVFDEEMKDEVKEVLREKEKELLLAYVVEKFRVEMRHRVATESVLEELHEEREKEFRVHQATNELIRRHLGLSGSEEDTGELKEALLKYPKEDPVSPSEKETDMEALRSEKEELERALNELQKSFKTERQEWCNKLHSSLQVGTDGEDKEKVIQSLRAQKVLMEQLLTTERFYLGRLYYLEMKEELETCLKQHRFERSGKYEKERVNQAWKHHAEVGELYQKILEKEAEGLERIREAKSTGSDGIKKTESSEDPLKEEMVALVQVLPLKLELVELQQKRCREHKAASLILEQAVNAVETAVQENDHFLVSGNPLQSSSPNDDQDNSFDSSRAIGTSKESDGSETEPAITSEIADSKLALKQALEQILQKVLNQQMENKDLGQEPYTSDSDFSERLSEIDRASDGEIHDDLGRATQQEDAQHEHATQKGDIQHENGEHETPQHEGTPNEGEVQEIPEVSPEKLSSPELIKVPSNIENVLNIERFNMSRLLRDEYMDKIRRNRETIEQMKERDSKNKSEILAQFRKHVGSLLEKTDFAESGKEGVSQELQELSGTPSNDSGIVDFGDADKEEVVKKYKELLEKARKDLNDANKALRKKSGGVNGLDKELNEMKQDLKEKEDDLKEIEEKRAGLDDERASLHGKIKSASDPGTSSAVDEETGHGNGDAVEKGPGCQSQEPQSHEGTEVGSKGETQERTGAHKGLGTIEEESSVGEAEEMERDENGGDDSRNSDGINEDENIGKEQVGGTETNEVGAHDGIGTSDGGSNVEQAGETETTKQGVVCDGVGASEDSAGKTGEMGKNENEQIKHKLNEMEKELEAKKQEFEEENQKKQDEINDLQRKLVEGTGGEEVVKDLQEKLNEAKEERNRLEAKCSELEKRTELGKDQEKIKPEDFEKIQNENSVLENDNKVKQEKIDELQRKLVSGSDGEEILQDLQNELKELQEKNKEKEKEEKEEKEVDPGDRKGAIVKLQKEIEVLEVENEEMGKKIEKLQNDLVKGTGSEDIVSELQNEVKDLKNKNEELEKKSASSDDKDMEKKGHDLKDEMEKLNEDNKKKNEEIEDLQKKLVEGSGGEDVLYDLQKQIKKLKDNNDKLEMRCKELGDLEREPKDEKSDVALENEVSKLQEENDYLAKDNKLKTDEIRDLQKALVDGSGGEAVLEKLQDKIDELEETQRILQKECHDLDSLRKTLQANENDLKQENEEISGVVARLEKENDYLERESDAKTGEISKLQEKLLNGGDGIEILKELQDQVKELEETNKELRKKCLEMETKVNNLESQQKAKTNTETKAKKEESGPRATAVQEPESCRGPKSGLEDGLEERSSETSEAQRRDKLGSTESEYDVEPAEAMDTQEELKQKVEDLEKQMKRKEQMIEAEKKQKEEVDKEADKMREENDYLERESKAKSDEITKLQEKMLDGSGCEDILKGLQDQVKDLENVNKDLRKKCLELESNERASKKVDEKLSDGQVDVNHGVSEEPTGEEGTMQGKDVGTSEEHKKESTDTLGNLKNEVGKVAAKDKMDNLCELLEENSNLKNQNKEKDDEICRLQNALVEGSGVEDVVRELQENLKEEKAKNKSLEKKCKNMESMVDDETGKNIEEIKQENEDLKKENKEKEEKIDKLQEDILKGTGSEEVLKEMKNKIEELGNENKQLKEKEKQGDKPGDRNDAIVKLENEKEALESENDEMGKKIEKLQNDLIKGTGSEDIVDELQNEVKTLKDANKKLGKEVDHLKDKVEKLTEDNKKKDEGDKKEKEVEKMKEERMNKLKDEKEKLLNDNKCKENEIFDLQKQILDGTGQEKVLSSLHDKIKELQDENEKLKNEFDKLEEVNAKLKDDDENAESEVSRFKEKVIENDNKKIGEVQRKLDDGSDVEKSLGELQLENGREGNENLTAQNKDISSSEMNNEKKEVEELKKLNRKLEKDKEEKCTEVERLQKCLVEGTGSEDVLQEFQEKVKELEERNEELQKMKPRKDLLKRRDSKEIVSDEDENGKTKEFVKLRNKVKELEKENEEQKDEIVELQKKLVAGTGGEEYLEELQEKLKDLKRENDKLTTRCDDLQNEIEKLSDMENLGKDKRKGESVQEERPDKEVEDRFLRKDDKFVRSDDKRRGKNQENQEKNNRIPGKDGEDRQEDKEYSEEIEKLKKKVDDLEKLKKDDDNRIKDLHKKKKELQELQNHLKDCEEKIKKLENKCSNLEKDRNNLRKENKKTAKAKGPVSSSKKSEDLKDKMDKIKKSKGKLSLPLDDRGQSAGEMRNEDRVTEECNIGTADDKEGKDETPSYPECLDMIAKISEERDHWKEKYGTLRDKVGGSFVDIIPEIWKEEEELEKQRDETISKLSEVKKEIDEKETPVVKNMTERERVEQELMDIEGQLEDCSEQLDHIRDLREQEERVGDQQVIVRKCLEELEANLAAFTDEEQRSIDTGDDDKETFTKTGSDQEKLNDKVNQLRHEMDILLDEAREDWKQQSEKPNNSELFDEKIQTKKDIRNLDQAIQDLQCLSTGAPGMKLLSLDSVGGERRTEESSTVQDQLHDIDKEVNELQSSLKETSGSSKPDIEVLVGLMKEKSKLEDEIAAADKALGQLSKRDQESLKKEREKQEQVAKQLLELFQEKQAAQNELNIVEVEMQAKQAELMDRFERKEDDGSTGKGKQKRGERRGSSVRKEDDDSDAAALSADENIEERFEEENALKSEDTVALSEELGVLIQKRSSISVRLDSLGKKITAQSQKVEKSLLGAKESTIGETTPGQMTPVEASPREMTSGGAALGSSFTSIDNLTQSQLSIFDNRGLVDELSLATAIVKDERIKRKASRKQPMAKLLKEKAGLDKKLKELEGRVLVGNAKIRNALREGKDPGKAPAKFVEAVEERKKVEEDIAGVLERIEDCKAQSDEFGGAKAAKGEKGKSEKGGKSMSKNDKRRLLAQRKSLGKQLEDVQKRIEDYGVEEALESFPEMAEDANVVKKVERLRELIGLEAQLKQGVLGEAMDDKVPGGSDKGVLDFGVIDILRKEKEEKEVKLAEIESGLNEKAVDKKDWNDLKKKLEALRKNLELTSEDLDKEQETIKIELKAVEENETSDEKGKNLSEEMVALQRKKDELEHELKRIQEFLESQTKLQESEELSENYQKFAKLKKEEEELERDLNDVNEKLETRKEWAENDNVVAKETHDVDSELVGSYGEILKRMEDEGVNMADLIQELKVTQETLSEEREITGELLELIKSRVGNELLEALTGDGLVSPTTETMVTAEDYQEVADKVGHEPVTVAEIIAEYKKTNDAYSRENQRLNHMLASVKEKLDDDLFDCIVNEEPSDVEVSKKAELSKILANNETIFQQISQKELKNEEDVGRVRMLEDENGKLRKDGAELDEENTRIKEELEEIKNEVRNVIDTLDRLEKEEAELGKGMIDSQKHEEDDSSKESIEKLKEKVECVIKEMNDLKMEKDEIEKKVKDKEDVEEQNTCLNETAGKLKEEVAIIKKELDELEKMKEQLHELSSKLEEAEEMKNELENKLASIKQEKKSVDEKLGKVEQEKNEAVLTNENVKKINDQIKEDLENELDSVKNKLATVESEYSDLIAKMEEASKIKDDMEEKLKCEQETREENEKLKETLAEFEEKSHIFEKQKEEILENVKRLEELREENNRLNEAVAVLGKENNQMLPALEDLKKTKRDLEDEVEYLRKDNQDLQSRERELHAEREQSLKEELEKLQRERNEVIDYIEKELQGHVTAGVKEALKDYNKPLKQMEEECSLLKKELKELKDVLGEKLVEKLLRLAEKPHGTLQDTSDTPKCVEVILKDQLTLAAVLERNEKELELIEQRLGKDLFYCVSGDKTGQESEPEGQPLKLIRELKEGEKDLTEIVKWYEDVIETQEKDIEMMKQAQSEEEKADRVDQVETSTGSQEGKESDGEHNIVEKVDEDEITKASHGEDVLEELKPLDMEFEYKELLQKVVEHQNEIEEAETMLFEQNRQHEREKQALLERFQKEKMFEQQRIDSERKSMEKAMQNLINEIVRLKEERKEIRKNNRLEKEKMETSFEKERADMYSNDEMTKSELKKETEKACSDVFEKEKRIMELREEELQDKLVKLKNEKKEIAAKLKEMEKLVEETISANEEKPVSQTSDAEVNEQLKDMFETKLKEEKKKFQEKIAAMKKEMERLKERNKTLKEISTPEETNVTVEEISEVSVYSFGVYEKMESDFRKKMESEKTNMERRINELRSEKEELNKQKQEIKGDMRKQRLEMTKKYEKEKNELIEKHRNEIKELRNKLLEKKENEQNLETNNVAKSLADAHELQRLLHEKNVKLRKYEMFFRELNQEAANIQQDADMAE